MSDSYFQMKDLSVGYHGNVLIHDICTEIKKGEILTLIGPNGSGKSTILKSITKQLTLIGGKVTIGEKNLKDLSYKELATQMAVVLTQRAKPELMTCYEVVAAGRYPYTGRLGILTREDEKKTQEALEIVHATEYAEKSFEAISDGPPIPHARKPESFRKRPPDEPTLQTTICYEEIYPANHPVLLFPIQSYSPTHTGK